MFWLMIRCVGIRSLVNAAATFEFQRFNCILPLVFACAGLRITREPTGIGPMCETQDFRYSDFGAKTRGVLRDAARRDLTEQSQLIAVCIWLRGYKSTS